jgi:Carbohydrate binding module (family 6)/GH141 insertion domain/Right handed beta helix region
MVLRASAVALAALVVVPALASACGSDDAGGVTPSGGAGGADAATGGSGGTGGDAGGDGAVPSPFSIYVSPDGTPGSTACSLPEPCKLTEGRDKARSLTPSASDDVHVILRGGSYRLAQTFELDTADSGQNGHTLRYEAYPGETPVLNGALAVGGFASASGALWHASVPAGTKSRQLWVNGVRATRARSAANPGFVKNATGYTAPDASFASFAHPSDLEVVSFVQWKSFRCDVASISGTAVTMVEPCWSLSQWHQGYEMGTPSWIENALELLDQPGEWYLDSSAGELYYWPRAGEDLLSADVELGVLETLVSITGTASAPVHDLSLSGLGLSYGTWLRPSSPDGYPVIQAGFVLSGDPGAPSLEKTPGNVRATYAERVRFERNVFEHLGAAALELGAGCQANEVRGNVFLDVSGGAVTLGEVTDPNPADPADVTEANTLGDNFVSDTGREYFDSVAVFAGYTKGTVIDHNEIANVPYTGISVGWGWSLDPTVAADNHVTNNLIHHVMGRLRDGAGIYTLSAQPGTSIDHNFVHSQMHDFGGLYLDQGSSGLTLSQNLVLSAPYFYLLQPTVPPAAQGNSVDGNLSDVVDVFCCGSLGCCTDVNSVGTNPTFSHGPPASWPAAALAIASGAGLEADYLDIRPAMMRIEAEDYATGGEGVGYHDLTSGNAGGAFRSDDVDLYGGPGLSGDVTVGYTQSGEWLDYYVVTPVGGTFTIAFSVATIDASNAIAIEVDAAGAGQVALPNTGDYLAFERVELGGLKLGAGPHLVRLSFSGGFNLDYFELARTGS